MRFPPLCCLVALSLAPIAARGQESTATRSSGNAFDAVRLLTPEQQAGLAIIAGRDGTPLPERWHLLVHDTAAENGLREFVVSRGRIVASRTVSQFAESLSREQVFAPESLKVDTDRVSRIAEEFGRANGVTIAAIHYDLRRSAPDGAPLWTAFCTNSSGEELGKTILNASTGAIIAHPGFAVAPSLDAGPGQIQPDPDSAATTPRNERPRRTRPTESIGVRRRMPAGPPPPPPATPKPGFFQRVFRGPPPARPPEPRR